MESTQNKEEKQNTEVPVVTQSKDEQKEETSPPVTDQLVAHDGIKIQSEMIEQMGLSQSQGIEQLTRPRIFWDEQPVPKLTDLAKPDENEEVKEGPIEVKTVEDVRKEPYHLPEGFEWCNVDLENEDELDLVYKLLTENYVEDDDNMFRFDYSKEFLKWALVIPNYYQDWIVGVRVSKNKKLVGFISGVPVHLRVGNEQIKMTEINFLCVYKGLRNKRLAPVLIKEITRRVNVRNMWQAVYTAGIVVPSPIAKARYYHRNLNPKKLIEIGFSALGHNQTITRLIKLNKLPEEPTIKGLRPMVKKDAAPVRNLLNNYLEQFKIFPHFSEMEILHFFVPRKLVIYSYVVQNEKGDITDLISFYHLPSSVLKNPKHKDLRAVYSFYNVATSVKLTELIENALILANNEEFDVFNALDIMENEEFLKDLKFSPGDGNLHYYLYNYRLKNFLDSKNIGLVLV